jgi:hypothetical protein
MSKRNRFPKAGRWAQPSGRQRNRPANRPLGFEEFSGLMHEHPPLPEDFPHCHGTELEHTDDSVTCSLGDECAGEGVAHFLSHTCFMFYPCERCGVDSPLLG